MPSVPVEARDLVFSSVPPLRQATLRTLNDSTHELEFKGTLGYWSGFESEVRHSSLSQQWSHGILAYAATGNHVSDFDLSTEHYACGDEYSVQGRFAQNVGQVMTSVFGSLGMDIQFGDFKTCSSKVKGKVPDFVMTSESGTLLAVGEGKTPWVHKYHAIIKREISLRHNLGQIARYMVYTGLKFGFLTTYGQTFFLRLEWEPRSEQWILWHSNVISGSARYVDVPSEPKPTKVDFHGKVTLRECFLFIGTKIARHSQQPGRHLVGCAVPDSLVGDYPKSHNVGVSKANFRYISDDKSIKTPADQAIPPLPQLSGSQRGVRPPSSSPNRYPLRGRSVKPARSQELEIRTGQPEPGSRSRSRAPVSVTENRDGYVVVYTDEEKGCHYFIGGDVRVQIDLEQNKKGNLSFKYNGRIYTAKLDKGKGKGKHR